MNVLPPKPPRQPSYEAIEQAIEDLGDHPWLPDDDTAKLWTALSRIEQVARAADSIRIKLVGIHDSISAVRGQIGRTRLCADSTGSAEALMVAIRELEDRLVELIVVLGRDMTDTTFWESPRARNANAQLNRALVLPFPDHKPQSARSPRPSSGGDLAAPQLQAVETTGSAYGTREIESLISDACNWLHAVADVPRPR